MDRPTNRKKKEARRRMYSNREYTLLISLVLALFFIFSLILTSTSTEISPTGFSVISNEAFYSANLPLVLDNNYNYTLSMNNYGELHSIKLGGTVSKGGSAKAYLEHDNESYLVFDSSQLKEKGQDKITGLAARGLAGNDLIEGTDEPTDNRTRSMIITIRGGGSKSTCDIFEFNISSRFNWDIDHDNLCTKWDANSELAACYGNEECCALLLDTEKMGAWNDSFYLSYGRYNSKSNNTISVQLIYYDVDLEVPRSEIILSNRAETRAEFHAPRTEFRNICIDTCSLPGFNATSYKLVFVIENASLMIDDIGYNLENGTDSSRRSPSLAKKLAIKAKKPNFKNTENPEFYINITDGGSTIIDDKLTAAYLKRPDRTIIDISNKISNLEIGKFSITLDPERSFRPGLYEIEVRSGENSIIKQNFTWGVLALNTHKSAYLENELADIGIAVLDDGGYMVCDADITLEITDPHGGKTTLTTPDDIIVTEACQIYDITKRPDYHTSYIVNSAGAYSINLTAATDAGTWNIEDSFMVFTSVDFDVSRNIAQTRIYPFINYTMSITVIANKNYGGAIREYVPSVFDITPQDGLTITTAGGTKTLSWDLNLKKEDMINLAYEFDAPDISPQFYLLGRLDIGSWQEEKYWQVASDAANGNINDDSFSCVDASLGVGQRTNCTGVYSEDANKPESWTLWLLDDEAAITRDDCLGDDFKVTDVDYTTNNDVCTDELNGVVTCNDWGAQVANQQIRWEIEACQDSDASNIIITEAGTTTSGTNTLSISHEISIVVPDTLPPTYNLSNNASVETMINGVVNWSINLSDNQGLSFYIFAHNDSGTLRNVSNGSLSGTAAFVNKTVTITQPGGNY
ncbi:hypothetical protein KY358_06055, partial [Candidatus Woesearchaeota archaeon]|nr:hypothetical protein [Candidatus Woesearchaeota archaeon]